MNTDKKLVEMTNEEFDKLMCEKFPELFRDRRKPMNQTCMCWGFNIGEGWHQLLHDLCEKLDFIRQQTGLITVFDQIKEKFGGGRFYYHIDGSACKLEKKLVELWASLISSLISKAERESDQTCAVCGENYYHDKIVLHGWVYDACKDCMINNKRTTSQDVAKEIEEAEKRRDRYESIVHKIERLDEAKLPQLESFLSELANKTNEPTESKLL